MSARDVHLAEVVVIVRAEAVGTERVGTVVVTWAMLLLRRAVRRASLLQASVVASVEVVALHRHRTVILGDHRNEATKEYLEQGVDWL